MCTSMLVLDLPYVKISMYKPTGIPITEQASINLAPNGL